MSSFLPVTSCDPSELAMFSTSPNAHLAPEALRAFLRIKYKHYIHFIFHLSALNYSIFPPRALFKPDFIPQIFGMQKLQLLEASESSCSQPDSAEKKKRKKNHLCSNLIICDRNNFHNAEEKKENGQKN